MSSWGPFSMRRIAGDAEQFRFRGERRAGGRGLGRSIGALASPRAHTSGDQAQQTSGGTGGGGGFGNFTGGGGGGAITDSGDVDTGARVAVWGHFAWDSTDDIFGV